MQTNTELSKVSIGRKILFGMGDLGENLSNGLIVTFFLMFCTDVCGVEAAAVGTLLIVGRFWDAINDTWVGAWSDRTNTRFGKYRPWIMWATVPLFAVTILLFWAHPTWSGSAKLIYLYVMYLLWAFAYTCVNIPYTALNATITQDPKERVSLSSWRMGFMSIGVLVTGSFFMPLVGALGRNDTVKGWLLAACVMAVPGVICLFLCSGFTKEAVSVKVETRENRMPIIKGMKLAFSNKYYLILLFGMFVAGIMTLGKMSVISYYFKYVLHDIGLMTPYMFALGLAAAAGGLCAQFFSNMLKSKGKSVSVLAFVSVACLFLQWTARFNPGAASFWIGAVLAQFCYYSILATIFGAVPDCVEYGMLQTGVHQGGLYSAYISFWHKVGIAIGSAGAGWALGALGYVPNKVIQSPSVIGGINFIMFWFPMIVSAAMGVAFLFYKLDYAKFQGVLAEVKLKFGSESSVEE